MASIPLQQVMVTWEVQLMTSNGYFDTSTCCKGIITFFFLRLRFQPFELTREAFLQFFPKIVQQTPAGHNLQGLRGTHFNTRFVFKGTVATDDLNLGMFLQPDAQGGLGSVGQQFNRLMLL